MCLVRQIFFYCIIVTCYDIFFWYSYHSDFLAFQGFLVDFKGYLIFQKSAARRGSGRNNILIFKGTNTLS